MMRSKFPTMMGAFALIIFLMGGVSYAAQDIPSTWPFSHWTADGKAFKNGEHVGWVELDDTGKPRVIKNAAGQPGISFTAINPKGTVAVSSVAGRPHELQAKRSLHRGVTEQSVEVHEINTEMNVNWGTDVRGHMNGGAFVRAIDGQRDHYVVGGSEGIGSENCVIQFPPSHMAAMVNAVSNGGDQETLEKILRDANVAGLDPVGVAEAMSAQIQADMVSDFNRAQMAMLMVNRYTKDKVCGTNVTTVSADPTFFSLNDIPKSTAPTDGAAAAAPSPSGTPEGESAPAGGGALVQ